jgi:putative sterol carrier protein
MTSATEAFFDGLASRRHEPLLEKVSGSLRFDLDNGRGVDQWFVTIQEGDITVERKGDEPNTIFYASASVFEKLASGEMNAMAALLRGEASALGDLELAVLMQRLLPGPQSSGALRSMAHSAAARPESVKAGVPRISAGYPVSSELTVDPTAARAAERR